MSVAVLADAHLGGPGGRAEPLCRQLSELPGRGCRHLVILGDLFQVWIGDQRYETADVRAVIKSLRELRQQGVEISYVEGNRDFFIESGSYRSSFDRVAGEVGFTVGGTRYLAVHGDGLDDKDWRYRFWRGLSKSFASRVFFRNLPLALARRIVTDTEERLSRTNFKHKIAIPKDVLRAYGASRLAEGYDVLLLGHFHEPLALEVEGGRIQLLDAWYHHRGIEWIEEAMIAESPSHRPRAEAARGRLRGG